MSDSQNSRAVPEDDLKRTLVRRVVLAGVMIAALLAVLAFIDYLGRPADFLMLKDGSLLVSDDHAGAIYRISYAGAK